MNISRPTETTSSSSSSRSESLAPPLVCPDCNERTDQVIFKGEVGDILGCDCRRATMLVQSHNDLILKRNEHVEPIVLNPDEGKKKK